MLRCDHTRLYCPHHLGSMATVNASGEQIPDGRQRVGRIPENEPTDQPDEFILSMSWWQQPTKAVYQGSVRAGVHADGECLS